MSCAVCGASAVRTKLRVDDTDILQCAACGLAFWVPPADFRPERIYDGSYFRGSEARVGYDDYGGLEESLRITFAQRLARLPRPREGARLLDVGAAYGFAVAESRRAGWDAVGIEVSAAAAREAARHAPGAVAVADGLRLPFAAERFDALTIWDTLEHLRDPHAVIGEAARVLRPGGRLVLTTGDVGSAVARLSRSRWHLYSLPEHLFFYSRRSLRLLLDAHGFAVESLHTESSIYTLGYLVERLRKSLLGRVAARPGRWPGARLRVRLNLFDIVTVRAVRARESGARPS